MTKYLLYITIVIIAVYSVFYFSSLNMTRVDVEKKVRIDSISSFMPYSTVPEIKYMYHTSCGNLTDNYKRYNVGDSIVITLVYIKHAEK